MQNVKFRKHLQSKQWRCEVLANNTYILVSMTLSLTLIMEVILGTQINSPLLYGPAENKVIGRNFDLGTVLFVLF